MGLQDIPGIGVVFGKAAEIFGDDYQKTPEAVVTDRSKMGVADPAVLDAYLAEVANKTGLDRSSIKVDDDNRFIRIEGGDVEAFKATFLEAADPEYNHEPVGRLDHDDPDLGYKNDQVYTLELPVMAPSV